MLKRSVASPLISFICTAIFIFVPTLLLAGEVHLAWNLNSEPDIFGYKLYFGTQSGTYDAPGSPIFIQHPQDGYTITGLQEGQEYFFALTAVDSSDNESPPTAEISTVVQRTTPIADTTPPTIAITNPLSGTPVSGTILVSATAADNIGVSGVQFLVDGSPLGAEVLPNTFSVPWETSALLPGSYTLTAIARDAAGNTTTSAPVVVSVDPAQPNTIPLEITNLIASSGKAYTVQQPLDLGQRIYLDRTYTFAAVPAPLVRAAYIQTANGDKNSTGDSFLSFDVNQPVTVYVAHDSRITTKPAWLASFTDTGLTLDIAGVPMPIWSQAFPAGSIALGGNRGSNEQASMYSVAVIAQHTPALDTTPPSSPTLDAAVANSPTQVTLSWSPATDNVGVTGYTLYRDNTPLTTTPNLSFVDTTLLASTTYTYFVVAHDAAENTSEPSASVSVTTLAPPDTTPPTVSITSPTSGESVQGTVTITATAADNTGVTGVQFLVDGSPLGAEVLPTTFSVPWETSALLPGSYTLTAIARDAAGNTTTSAPVVVSVDPAQPNAPPLEITNLVAASGKAYAVQQPLALGQRIYLDRTYTFAAVPASLVGASYIQTANGDKNSTGDTFLSFEVNQPVTVYVAHDSRITTKPSWLASFSDTGLTLDIAGVPMLLWSQAFPAGSIALGGNRGSTEQASMYSVAVIPSTGLGNGSNSQDTTPPSITTITSAIANSASQVSLNWDPASDNVDVTGYEVYRDGTLIATTSEVSYVDSSLSPLTTYAYEVRAVDAAGNLGPLSDSASVTTLSQEPQTASGEAQLSWQKSPESDLSHYVVYYGTSSGNYEASINVGLTATPNTPRYTITGLPSGTFYFTVRAVDNSGNESPPAPEKIKIIKN